MMQEADEEEVDECESPSFASKVGGGVHRSDASSHRLACSCHPAKILGLWVHDDGEGEKLLQLLESYVIIFTSFSPRDP